MFISVDFMSFSCNSQYFDQNDGLFIGSPTSPAFAELYIQRVEEIHVYTYTTFMAEKGWQHICYN